MNKKILFLGASMYFFDAAVYAKQLGLYLVAVDAKDLPHAVVKDIADEFYKINTTDIDALMNLCKKLQIDGIYAGASETNIPIAIQVCEELGLPYYTEMSQWQLCTNKALFKSLCVKNGIQVARVYSYDQDIESSIESYPVVTKPVDNNGSTGITICNNINELHFGYEIAKRNSKSGEVLIEEYIPSDSVIIHYTVQDGVVKYCGMSDKKSRKIKQESAPVMALQLFPSEHEQQYIDFVDSKAVKMFEQAGFAYGAIWIEAFYHKGEFIFNEVGFRFGGSLTYYPVEYFYGINQMHLLINHAVTSKGIYNNFSELTKINNGSFYGILPIQIKPCEIHSIDGLVQMRNVKGFYRFVQSHVIGDVIQDTGTTLQVFGYLHVVGDSIESVIHTMQDVLNILKVYDQYDNNNKLFTVWSFENE